MNLTSASETRQKTTREHGTLHDVGLGLLHRTSEAGRRWLRRAGRVRPAAQRIARSQPEARAGLSKRPANALEAPSVLRRFNMPIEAHRPCVFVESGVIEQLEGQVER